MLLKLLQNIEQAQLPNPLFANSGLTSDQIRVINEDVQYGLDSTLGLQAFKRTSHLRLATYFDLASHQMFTIKHNLERLWENAVGTLKVILQCEEDCSSKELITKQWAQSEVSQKLLDKLSIADNITIFGSLEFNSFYQNRYAYQPQWQGQELTEQQAKTLLDFHADSLKPGTSESSLINPTNINLIYDTGLKYEKDKKNSSLWKQVVKRFQLKSW